MERILEAYLGTAQKYEKAYHYSSQKRTLGNIRKYSGLDFSIRTLNRKLRVLEDSGYISRKQRHLRDKDGTFRPGSTLTHLKARAFDWMARRLMKAARVFSFYRMPKMALNRFTTTRYQSPVGTLASLITSFFIKGAPSAVFRTT